MLTQEKLTIKLKPISEPEKSKKPFIFSKKAF